jgi:signal peptidase II
MIDATLSLNQTVSVIDGFFNITYVPNTGIAFGILNSASLPAKTAIFSIFAGGAAIGVVVYSLRSPAGNRLLQTGLSLILAGALGNVYDRITYGYVIDFLEFYFRSYHWPSFNVADSAITVGVALLALEILRNDRPSSETARRA